MELWEFDLVTFSSIKQFISDRDYLFYTNTFVYRDNKESFIENKRKANEENSIKNKSLLEKNDIAENIVEQFKKIGGERVG